MIAAGAEPVPEAVSAEKKAKNIENRAKKAKKKEKKRAEWATEDAAAGVEPPSDAAVSTHAIATTT